jgi:hypothetical protein
MEDFKDCDPSKLIGVRRKWDEIYDFILTEDPFIQFVWLPSIANHPKSILILTNRLNYYLYDLISNCREEEVEVYVHDYLPGPDGKMYPSIIMDSPSVNENLLNLNLTDL